MNDKQFTPALGYRILTPVYDLAVRLLTRENTWRSAVVALLAPQAGERILDVGCGTGSLLIRVGKLEPEAKLIGLDPDSGVLEIARRKAEKSGVDVLWQNGFLDQTMVERIGPVSTIVSTLVFHQTSLDAKADLLSAMYSLLQQDGRLCIADYGLQRTRLMRTLFRTTVQAVDGTSDTQPNADGVLPKLIQAAGFVNVRERDVINTSTGSISLYQASRA